MKLVIDYISVMSQCLDILYHQTVATSLQSAETDAEEHRRGVGVVVDEATTLGLAVVPVEGQVGRRVAGVEHRAEVDLQSDGLNPTVNTDVPLTCGNKRGTGAKRGRQYIFNPIFKFRLHISCTIGTSAHSFIEKHLRVGVKGYVLIDISPKTLQIEAFRLQCWSHRCCCLNMLQAFT